MKHLYALRLKDYIEEKILAVFYFNTARLLRKSLKNLALSRIWIHDLCDAGAVLYQLSYQTNWALVVFWVHNVPLKNK